MTTQLSLFDTLPDIPASRRGDPLSSVAAESRIKTNGVYKKQLESVYEAICKSPGSTASELAALYGLDRYMVSKRLPVLEKRCLVYRDYGQDKKPICRICAITNYLASIWWPSSSKWS